MSDAKTLIKLGRDADHRDAGARRLEQAARDAWAEGARGKRWTLWVRLSFATPVSPITAEKHVTNWATQFRSDVPGAAFLVGFHTDTARTHAHALVFIPRRLTDPHYPVGISIVGWSWIAWLQLRWRRGQVWAEPYDPGMISGTRGAAAYLARDPGSVVEFGKAPPR